MKYWNLKAKIDINDVLESERPAYYLYHYALSNGRLSSKWERLFLEFKNMWYIVHYTKYVIKDRWPEAEPILLESKNKFELYYYTRYVIKDRWPEAEPIILKSKDIYYITLYAEYVIEGRWPEAEPLIKQDKFWWKRYYEFNIKEENGHK